jgi:Tol biopolymer transport system component
MLVKRMMLVLFICAAATSFAQKNKAQPGNLSPIFDISPDNKSIVVSIANGAVSNLYAFSLAENKLTQLTSDQGYYSRPVYAPKGDKIIFLSKGLEAETSDLYSLDLATGKATKLTDGKTYVTEASFMPNGNEIIYCGAGTITNYSPLARKAPHEIDLYTISTEGGSAKKLTDLKAYELSHITPNQQENMVLCKMTVKGAEGVYLLSLSDTTKTKIEAVNNPRPGIGESFYDSPAYSKDNKQISFMAPYQLYLMNLSDKKCEEIWSTFGKDKQAMPIFSRFDGTDQKVIFAVLPIINRQYSGSAQLYSYDLGTKKTTQLFLPLTK